MRHALQGKRILITREKKQARPFAEKVKQLGGDPLIADLLKIDCTCHEKDRKVLDEAEQYDWLFFTSANGVHCFFERAHAIPGSIQIAVVGTKTKEAVLAYGYEVDFMPSIFNAKTMVREFMAQYPTDQSALLIQGQKSRKELADAFTAEGRPFSRVIVYETKTNEVARESLNHILKTQPPDYITFTSPSTVEAFVDLAETNAPSYESVIVCIGTTTERRALAMGFQNVIVPATFTMEGMLEKISDDIEGGE